METPRPYIYKFKVTSVYDGDTITGDIDLGFNVILRNQKIRLYGINAPEISGTDRPQGLITKERVRALIEGKDVVLESYRDKTEKYGRWLGIIHYKTDTSSTLTNLNEQLVTEGLAQKYLLD